MAGGQTLLGSAESIDVMKIVAGWLVAVVVLLLVARIARRSTNDKT